MTGTWSGSRPAPPVDRPSGAGLHAVRLSLGSGPAIDPTDVAAPSDIVFESGSRTLVGIGSALAIPLAGGLGGADGVDAVRRSLAAIHCVDESGAAGSGVIALGALPFDRSEPTALVVPRIVYGRDGDGPPWATVVVGAGEALPDSATALRSWLVDRARAARDGSRSAGDRDDAAAPVIEPLVSDAGFLAMVGEALRLIHRGDLEKVVLARQVDVHTGAPVDVLSLLDRWRRLEPNCTVFSLPTPHGRFVGASPELLVERRGDRVRSRPLAGTTGRAADGPDHRQASDLLGSSKDADEHRLVVDAIARALAPLCSELDVPSHPDLVHLHSITHLGTTIAGSVLRPSDGPAPTALDLVAALHPTPAVAGVPVGRALEAIRRLEPTQRGQYAGAVGYVDAAGDGEWVVGIRAVTLSGSSGRLAAGVGIVGASDPTAELHETDLKFTSVFDALVPGQPFSSAPRRAV